jgi:hypothetical protein
MRPSLIGGLLVCGILAAGVAVPSAVAVPVPGNPGKAPERPDKTWEVVGVGATAEAAELNALRQARERVEEYLTGKYGSRFFLPEDPAYLRSAGIARTEGDPRPTQKKFAGQVLDGPPLEVTLAVELRPEHVRDLLQQGREQRMGQRQRLAGLGLAGVLVLLVVVAGYLRLEDATKGYYTTLLRLAALSVLGLTGLCLYQLV